MAFDRRTLLLGMGLTLASACARAEKRRGRAVKSDPLWPAFKSAFLDPSGRIVDNGNGGISHSEGQSYALLLALWNDDRATFDAVLGWTERTLARQDMALFSWRYDPRAGNPVSDPNNATDGDIAIAWALAEAARQWRAPAYAQRSTAIRAAIRSHLVVERFGQQLLLPGLNGFAGGQGVTLNPSYYLWPALDLFRQLEGDAAWGRVIADGEALLARARFGPLALPTDWIDVTGRDSVVPAANRPPRFGFDAIRAPLYAQAGKRLALVAPVRDYWRSYAANQRPIPAFVDVQSGEVAPYALSQGGMEVATRIMGIAPPPTSLAPDYYAAALQMLARHLL
ncbi:MAG: glycosyl hydrolase family 8 [Sphingobium sp.]